MYLCRGGVEPANALDTPIAVAHGLL